MKKLMGLGFWAMISRIVLRNRILMLSIILLITVLFALQWKNVRFTHTEANLLPADNEVNTQYNTFLHKFGEEGNLIVIALKDKELFTPKVFVAWQKLMKQLKNGKEISLIISVDNLKKVIKNDELEKFELVPFVDANKQINEQYLDELRNELFDKLPFYEGLIFNKESGSVRAAIYMEKSIVNTPRRKDYVLNKLIPSIEEFEKETGVDLRVSGMPYIRTLSAQTIINEISLFIGVSLLITSLLFYFFFRSIKTTLISLLVVIIGVLWSFGLLGLFNYEITLLTAMAPTLMIVIGVPNCIFLTNRYHQEYNIHRNKIKSLQRITTKIGMATLMTNLTTAIGFFTFVTTNNKVLMEFGLVTSINIMLLFALCMILIPILFSFIAPPEDKHLEHLERGSVKSFMKWIIKNVQHNRMAIYIVAIAILVIGVVGITKMRISGSLIEDMPKKQAFFDDILYFEKEFDGVMPLEIMVDTKRKKAVTKLSTLRKIDELEKTIVDIPELSKPISIVSLVKYSKQAFYNGNPEYYDLPTTQEQSFILSYAKNASKNNKDNLMKNYVDADGQCFRITTFMRDENGGKIPQIEKQIRRKADKLFPPEKNNTIITGKALVFQKGTSYLLDNLVSSLILAFILTGILVSFMFRSVKMVIVALIPNMLPLLMTAGLMGYLDIPLKPSTILVFGIAFGLSVDDTIRYLSQYREELIKNNWKIKTSVFSAFSEASLSMFYTSIVLFFGFSVFLLSSFGGTIALGGLISITLLFGLLSNLMLLPALVLTLNKKLANKQELAEPIIDIAEHSEEELDKLDKDLKK